MGEKCGGLGTDVYSHTYLLIRILLGCVLYASFTADSPAHAGSPCCMVLQLPLAYPRDSLGCPGGESPAPGGSPSSAGVEAAPAKIASSISWGKPE